jgi:glyceraldehyde-3-phosphate dehydrogenase (NADP+)
MSERVPRGNDWASEAQPFPMFIEGCWVGTGRPEKNMLPVSDPENGRLLAKVPSADAADVERVLRCADRLRETARGLPTHRRIAILRRAANLIEDDAEGFAQTIACEGIKTIREARLEVQRAVETLRLCAEEARRLSGETILFDQRPGSEARSGYALREPIGIVLAITPFNDPLNLVIHKVGPAIAAGNCVILKPHEATPLSALRLAGVLEAAGVPPGMLQVITGLGHKIGDQLVADKRVRMVSFTGGRSVGERVQRVAGLKRTALELGGNCATIVLADADLEQAVARCVSGAFWAAGQNCLHVQRIFVAREFHAAFRSQLVARTLEHRFGPKLDETMDMGCLINEGSAARLEDQVTSAVQSGAQVLAGGTRQGTLFAPTLMENVPACHPLAVDEAFGPVTVVSAVFDLDEAIAAANAVDYGLHAAIFTRDLRSAHNAIERLEAGAVIVNDSTDYRIDAMPFGGTKGSGLGREGVRSTLLEMSEPKVVCFDHSAA